MTVAIGDLQGCDASLGALLGQLPADAGPLWFCGDLVNRGPASLESLRRVRALGDRATVVLGNHDLHLLAVAAGARGTHRGDTLEAILRSPERGALLDWLRARPLAHRDGRHLLVHAGLWPAWTADAALAAAAEVETVLRGPHWGDFLHTMYGNRPDRWDDALSGDDRLRAIVNALTRMRYVDGAGRMDFAVKDDASAAPPHLRPWFDAPGRRSTDVVVVFGHWSTLGLLVRPDVVCLDTGCVWGGSLTAMRLEDGRVYSERCPQAQRPG